MCVQAHDTQRHVLRNGAFFFSISSFVCLSQPKELSNRKSVEEEKKTDNRRQKDRRKKKEGKQKPKQTQNRITTQYCCRRWNGKTSEEKKDTWWFQSKTGTHCVCTVNYTFCCILCSIQQQKKRIQATNPAAFCSMNVSVCSMHVFDAAMTALNT